MLILFLKNEILSIKYMEFQNKVWYNLVISFVITKQKIGQSIAIFADTKITFDTNAPHFFGAETEKRVRQFGMIKNIK